MPVLFKGGQSTPPSSTDVRAGSTIRPARPSVELNQSSSADDLAGSNTRLARPSAQLDQSSSGDGRAGSTTRPARPSAELNQSSSADGRAGSNTRPARPSAELDQISSADGQLDRTRDQLVHPPRWASTVRQMAELERLCCLHPVLAAPPPPSGLEQTCPCFISIGVTVGTLRFKNRKNSFSPITFEFIV